MNTWTERCIKYPGLAFGDSLRKAKARATKRKVPFNLDKEFLSDLFEKQSGMCFYSGVQLNVVKKGAQLNDPLKMTLDCVDPDKGYVKGNVVWCAFCINSFKQKMSIEQMVDICSGIIKTSGVKT